MGYHDDTLAGAQVKLTEAKTKLTEAKTKLTEAKTKLADIRAKRERAAMMFMGAGIRLMNTVTFLCAAKAYKHCHSKAVPLVDDVQNLLTRVQKTE